MKFSLLADIHANLPALEAVLRHAHNRQADRLILNLGDLTGYGAFPNKVVKRMQSPRVVNILGDYDQKVLDQKNRKSGWGQVKTEEKRKSFAWTYQNLSSRSRKFLKSLPPQKHFSVGGLRLLLTHGSPASSSEHLGPNTPDKRLTELAAMVNADVIFCGNSHQSFSREVAGVEFINPGSVGRPDDGDPRASYTVIEIKDGKLTATPYRVPYDLNQAVAGIYDSDLPDIFAQIFLQGHSYDDVVEKLGDVLPTPPLQPSGILTLLTDFGLKDHFVGVMKGVIAELAPQTKVIDITHQIQPQNLAEGARTLAAAVPFFTPGSVHVAVVDPGVGTARRALAAQIGDHYFVAPDNGLLTPIIRDAETAGKSIRIVTLDQPKYWLSDISHSFHGRDIFAPVGAHLVNGLLLEKLGTEITDPILLELPKPQPTPTGWLAEVVMVDVFGNLSTNLSAATLFKNSGKITVEIKDAEIQGVTRTFGDAQPGNLIATIDSSGSLAISIVNGSAAQVLEAGIGTPVKVTLNL